MGKTKLADVARAAGVSPMTVSRVLNEQGGASAATVERIRRIAAELDYRPNALARGLKSRRSGIIGVMVPDIANPFFPEIIRGVEGVAMQHGYNALLCNVIESEDRESDLLRTLETQRVDGVILCSARLPEALLVEALGRFKAAVLVNRSARQDLAGSITIDYRAGAGDAGAHLWSLGRRRIGVVAGPLNSRGALERLEGLQAFLHLKNAAPVGVVHCTPDLAGGAEAADRLLRNYDVDALVCYNDLNGTGALQACRLLGRRVPADLSVIGFDDIPLAEIVQPPLSTLRVDKYSIGQLAMRMLLERISGRYTQHNIVIRPELVVRESSGAERPSPDLEKPLVRSIS